MSITIKFENGRADLFVDGNLIGAVYPGVNLVLFKKDLGRFESLDKALDKAKEWCIAFYLDWFNNYLSPQKMAADYNLTERQCIVMIDVCRTVTNQ